MAKTSSIQRNLKRIKLVKKFLKKRESLKKLIKNKKLSIRLFFETKRLLAIPLIPIILPLRMKNKATDKPINKPPVKAVIGVKLTMFI